jgi:serine O-acetyltransferase
LNILKVRASKELVEPPKSVIEPQKNSTPLSLRELWQQIKEDWDANGRDWTKPGFRTLAIYRFGVWRMQLEPKLLRAPFSVLYRMLYRKARNTYGIDLPYTTQVGRRLVIEHQGCIVVHGHSVIGDDCIIRQSVTLGNRYLDRPFETPKLGNRVNVGAGAQLLGGITIGDDAVIGANAVVLDDVPARHTAVGVPAVLLPPKDEVAKDKATN